MNRNQQPTGNDWRKQMDMTYLAALLFLLALGAFLILILGDKSSLDEQSGKGAAPKSKRVARRRASGGRPRK
jgi:hypothetical protein